MIIIQYSTASMQPFLIEKLNLDRIKSRIVVSKFYSYISGNQNLTTELMKRLFLFVLVFNFISIVCEAQLKNTTINFTSTSYNFDGAFYGTPAKANNDNVIIGSQNKNIYFFTKKGELISMFEAEKPIHSTAKLLSNNLLALGCFDKNIYFFKENGELVKQIQPGGKTFPEVEELPDGRIFFGTNKGRFVIYNLEDDSQIEFKDKKLVHGAPLLLSNGNIAVGSSYKRMYIFSDNCELKYVFKTKGWIMHSKPVELENGNIVFGSYDKHIYCINSKAELVWKYKTKGRIHASPIQLSNGTIICGSFDGNVYFLSPNGELLNTYETKRKIIASATIVNDSTFAVGGIDKQLYFLSNEAELISKFDAKGSIFSTPIVLSDETVVCATMNGKIHFIKPSIYF
ncbi:MAG: PQQ-binding-like beta-propeller repeat protein [Prolixibacteraceae bacterium]|nr:PQQ-binding-like beta-propeller repeat protein [Prolixibacteraceae bacterium]